MKQKFVLEKNNKKNELIIREYCELEENEYSLFCEERYDGGVVKSAIKEGGRSLLSILRTQNMFPPHSQAEKLAESVINLYDSEDPQSIKVFFDSKDSLSEKV